MAQISLLSGIGSDTDADCRQSYPINLIPVPKDTGVSKGYLRAAPGLTQFSTGPGVDRGGINWNGALHRVMGTDLVRIDAAGLVAVVSDEPITGTGQASIDYGTGQLMIVADLKAWYYDGLTFIQLVDPDLGNVIDGLWIDGYFVYTDGEFLIVTELSNPFSVDPLKYGSSEAAPDPITGLLKYRGELYAFNRYSIEVFQNVGGTGFPFSRIASAMIEKGAVGTYAKSSFGNSFAWLGGGRNEPCSVYVADGGQATKIATREVEKRLKAYTEEQLATAVLEAREDEAHQHLMIHLPGETLVYDLAASLVAQEPIWLFLSTGVSGVNAYRGRNFVWAYGKWICGDTQDGRVGYVDESVTTQYTEVAGWQFDTMHLYNGGNPATVWSLELVGTTGRAPFGEAPTVFHSYTVDGENFSQERPVSMGTAGQTTARVQWRRCGDMTNMRAERFRGSNKTPVSWMRLEAQLG